MGELPGRKSQNLDRDLERLGRNQDQDLELLGDQELPDQKKSKVESRPGTSHGTLRMASIEEGGFIDLKIVKIEEESKDIKSFLLEKVGVAKKVRQPIPGQHLKVFVSPKDSNEPVSRSYTISGFTDTQYRLSIKNHKKGKVSSYISQLKEGDVIRSREPRGEFVLSKVPAGKPAPKSLVFLSAGIGITPIVAILKHALEMYIGQESKPNIYWIHGTRKKSSLPKMLLKEMKKMLKLYRKNNGETFQLIQFSKKLGNEVAEKDAGHQRIGKGRVTPEILRDLFSEKGMLGDVDGTQVYMCAPSQFMDQMFDGILKDYPHVYTETF